MYKQCCEEALIPENYLCVLPTLLKTQNKKGEQGTLDGLLTKVEHTFSRADVLKAIAEFIVCDDQVKFRQSCDSVAVAELASY